MILFAFKESDSFTFLSSASLWAMMPLQESNWHLRNSVSGLSTLRLDFLCLAEGIIFSGLEAGSFSFLFLSDSSSVLSSGASPEDVWVEQYQHFHHFGFQCPP